MSIKGETEIVVFFQKKHLDHLTPKTRALHLLRTILGGSSTPIDLTKEILLLS